MLFASNVFMTFAWYGHLKFKESPLPLVIMVSWGIAFFEYWLAVPANRWGSAVYSAAQLKTMQEVITLVVFAGFSVLYLKEPLGWNHALGFVFIAAGAFLIFHKWVVHRASGGTDDQPRGRAKGSAPRGRVFAARAGDDQNATASRIATVNATVTSPTGVFICDHGSAVLCHAFRMDRLARGSCPAASFSKALQ